MMIQRAARKDTNIPASDVQMLKQTVNNSVCEYVPLTLLLQTSPMVWCCLMNDCISVQIDRYERTQSTWRLSLGEEGQEVVVVVGGGKGAMVR